MMHSLWNPSFPGGLNLVYSSLSEAHQHVPERQNAHSDRIQLFDSHIFSKHFSGHSVTMFSFPAFLDFFFQLVGFLFVWFG